jgi:hypothetical protein
LAGKTYASIDAVSKPTKKVAPSGQYDPAAARQRYAEWQTRSALNASLVHRPAPAVVGAEGMDSKSEIGNRKSEIASRTSPLPSPQSGEGVNSSANASRTGHQDYDPEVGF